MRWTVFVIGGILLAAGSGGGAGARACGPVCRRQAAAASGAQLRGLQRGAAADRRLQDRLETTAGLTGRVDLIYTFSSGQMSLDHFWFRALKPNYYEIRQDWRELHCDGITLYDMATDTHAYEKRSARNQTMFDSLDLPGLETFTHGGIANGRKVVGPLVATRFQGLPCNAYTVETADRPGYRQTFYLDATTGLPLGVKAVSPDDSSPGIERRIVTVTARYHDLKFDPPVRRRDFAWQLPADATPAVPLEIGPPVPIGAVAPAFTVKTADGATVALADLLAKNRVVLLDFWEYHCGPCRYEMPRLQRLAERYKGRGFQVLTIDVYDDDLAASRQLLKKLQVSLPMAMDGKGTTSLRYRYGIVAVPCNYLIGPDGRVLARLEGWNEAEVLKILQEAGISAP